MKKIILISFLIVTFTLVGCNHNTAEPPKSDPNPEKTVDKPEEKPEDKQNEDPADKPTEDPVETNDFNETAWLLSLTYCRFNDATLYSTPPYEMIWLIALVYLTFETSISV